MVTSLSSTKCQFWASLGQVAILPRCGPNIVNRKLEIKLLFEIKGWATLEEEHRKYIRFGSKGGAVAKLLISFMGVNKAVFD